MGLPSSQETLGMIPGLRQGVVVEVMHMPVILAPQVVEAEESQVQGHSQLHSKCLTGLGQKDTRPCL